MATAPNVKRLRLLCFEMILIPFLCILVWTNKKCCEQVLMASCSCCIRALTSENTALEELVSAEL